MKPLSPFHSATYLNGKVNGKDLATLWRKFRDIEPREYAWLHIEYCEQIQEKIYHSQPDEAFRLLLEGFQRYDLLEGFQTPAPSPAKHNPPASGGNNFLLLFHRLAHSFRCRLF